MKSFIICMVFFNSISIQGMDTIRIIDDYDSEIQREQLIKKHKICNANGCFQWATSAPYFLGWKWREYDDGLEKCDWYRCRMTNDKEESEEVYCFSTAFSTAYCYPKKKPDSQPPKEFENIYISWSNIARCSALSATGRYATRLTESGTCILEINTKKEIMIKTSLPRGPYDTIKQAFCGDKYLIQEVYSSELRRYSMSVWSILDGKEQGIFQDIMFIHEVNGMLATREQFIARQPNGKEVIYFLINCSGTQTNKIAQQWYADSSEKIALHEKEQLLALGRNFGCSIYSLQDPIMRNNKSYLKEVANINYQSNTGPFRFCFDQTGNFLIGGTLKRIAAYEWKKNNADKQEAIELFDFSDNNFHSTDALWFWHPNTCVIKFHCHSLHSFDPLALIMSIKRASQTSIEKKSFNSNNNNEK